MGNLAIGLILIGLAVLVGFVFLVGTGGTSLTGDPFDVPGDPGKLAPDHDAFPDDPTTVIVTLNGERRPGAVEPVDLAPFLLGPEDRDGSLTPEERRSVDDQGFLEYTIVPGDTLGEISKTYLGKASLWRIIQDHNPWITDPRSLRVGTVIRIPLRERE